MTTERHSASSAAAARCDPSLSVTPHPQKHALPATPVSAPAHLAAVLAAIEAAAAANTAAFRAAGRPEPVNRFSSRSVPPMSLAHLSSVMLRGTDSDESLAMSAAVLMVRFCATSGTPLTSKMMHRLFIAALHVAIKTHSDRYFRNDAFALLSGLRCLEMNLLEAALLGGLGWRCLVEAWHVAAVVASPEAFVAQVPKACSASHTTIVIGTAGGTAASIGTKLRGGSSSKKPPSPFSGESTDGSYLAAVGGNSGED